MDRIKAAKNKAVLNIESISKVLICCAIMAVIYGCYVEYHAAEELILALKEGAARDAKALFITEVCEGLVLIIHYILVLKFFFDELKKGQVFNHHGAKELRIIGWETIILPTCVNIISLIAYGDTQPALEVLNFEVYELVLGIFIIQTGYVVDYATAKIERGHFFHEVYRYVREHDPELLEKAKNEIRGEKWLEENSVTDETELL